MNNQDAINNAYFKTYSHVKHVVPNMKPADVKKALKQRSHDSRIRKLHLKPYMRKIFERVPGCFFHDLLQQPRGAEPKYFHIFIGANNRYAFAYPVNDKSAATAIETLNKFIKDNHNKPIRKLTSDGECAFNSNQFVNACQQNGIMLKIIPDGAHSSLGIADRFIRTLRDMNQPKGKSDSQQYSKDYIEFTNDKMHSLINAYNNSYHNSIGCSPKQMYNDENLEKEYIAKCIKQRSVQDAIIDFNIPAGTYVRYRMNDYDLAGHKRRGQLSREKYKINKRLGSRYLLEAADGKIISKSRFELIKAADDDPIGKTFEQNKRVNPESVYTGILYT